MEQGKKYTLMRSKVLRHGKKRKAKKEQHVNNDLSVTMHNSAHVNINHLLLLM